MESADFLELVRRRQSVRGYLPQPVESEKLQRCLEAARLAPSACNSQPWTFVVVQEPELRHQLADAAATRWLPLNHWTKQAPLLVVIVVEAPTLTARLGSRLKQRDFPWIDLGIAAEHFCLQATTERLGTCMLGWFDEEKVQSLLGIPPTRRVGLIITLGYPSEGEIRPKKRKPFDRVVRRDRYRRG